MRSIRGIKDRRRIRVPCTTQGLRQENVRLNQLLESIENEFAVMRENVATGTRLAQESVRSRFVILPACVI